MQSIAQIAVQALGISLFHHCPRNTKGRSLGERPAFLGMLAVWVIKAIGCVGRVASMSGWGPLAGIGNCGTLYGAQIDVLPRGKMPFDKNATI